MSHEAYRRGHSGEHAGTAAPALAAGRGEVRLALTGLALALLASGVAAQERDTQAPHDPGNGIDCNACHVPFGAAPLPTPPDWISNSVCRSCHIESGTATPMSVHVNAAGATLAQCTDCHNPHEHQPDYPHDFIRTSLQTSMGERSLAWRGEADFLHGAAGVTQPYDGICESCHTQTAFHRNNGGGEHGHYSVNNCAACHRHATGFSREVDCSVCHGAPPATGAHLAHFGAGIGQVEYGRTLLDNLSTPTGYAFACGVCHPYDVSLHLNGVVDVELHNDSATPGSLKSLSPATATYTPGPVTQVDEHGLSYTLGTCSSVYCHSALSRSVPGPVGDPIMNAGQPVRDARGNLSYAPYTVTTSTSYRTVGWGDGPLSCAGCHQSMPRSTAPGVVAGAGDSHSWIDEAGNDNLHSWNMGFDALGCRTCHYNTVTAPMSVPRDGQGVALYPDAPIADKSFHVNGRRDVAFDPVNAVTYVGYNGVSHSYAFAGSAWDAESRTCSSVPCHLSQAQPEWGKPYRWNGGTAECDQCHRYYDNAIAGHPAVGGTVHNLSSAGSGTVRATTEANACVFCHTSHPHNTSAAAPQWNRNDPAGPFTPYPAGSSMQATMGNPSGSSRPCLSCHDGASVVGQVISRGVPIAMQGVNAQGRLNAGAANLGTSFANDHPFSFAPVLTDAQIVNPPLASPVKLDAGGMVQCGTCHGTHDNSLGDFLVMANGQSALCVTCHVLNGWAGSQHGHPAGGLYPQLLNQACTSCHQTHSASVGPRLVRASEETLCYSCHDAAVNNPWEVASINNIVTQFNKTSKHPVASTNGVHNPGEGPTGPNYLPEISPTAPRHVDCSDCHNTHAVSATNPQGGLDGALAGQWGIAASGAFVSQATAEYQICLKCHGNSANRPANQPNKILEFQTSNLGHHAVFGQSTSAPATIPSLISPWTRTSTLKCSDCHGSDTATGAQGVHGSTYSPILKKNYDQVYASGTPYSTARWALCFTCHNNTYFSNEIGNFNKHKKHVFDKREVCAACHNAHGTSAAHMIQMDTSFSYILPSSSGRLEFINGATPNHGSCYVRCHGTDHNPKTY